MSKLEGFRQIWLRYGFDWISLYDYYIIYYTIIRVFMHEENILVKLQYQ